MPDVLQQMMGAGMANPDGSLTDYGQFIGRIKDHPQRDDIKRFYHEGLIKSDLTPTTKGKVWAGGKREALRYPATYKIWKDSGADKQWKEAQPSRGSLFDVVGDTMKNIAVIGAKGVAGTITMAEKGVKDLVGIEEEPWEGTPYFLANYWEDWNRTQATLVRGGELVLKKHLPLTKELFDEDEKIEAERKYYNTQAEFEEMSAAEAAGVFTALLEIAKGSSPEEMLEAVDATERKVIASEVALGGSAENVAQAGQGAAFFASPEAFIPAAGSLGASWLRSSAVSTRRASQLVKESAALTAQRDLLQSQLTMAERLAKTGKGAKAVDAAKDELAKVQRKIDGTNSAVAAMRSQSGVFDELRDATRVIGQRLGQTKAVRGVAKVAGKVDDVIEGSVLGSGAIGFLGTLAMVPGAMGPAAIAGGMMAAGARFRLMKNAFRSAQIMGGEFLKRRTANPYWKRVAEAATTEKKKALGFFGKSMHLAVDNPISSWGINSAGRVGKAAASAVASEMPFSYVAAGGEEGWLADAIAEGLTLGLPGEVHGLIHSMGIPFYGKRSEVDLLALNNQREMRRILPTDQQQLFDLLDADSRRAAGNLGMLRPDLNLRFREGGGGYYDSHTGTATIDVRSENPLGVLMAHEALHHMAEQGLRGDVIRILIGDEEVKGYLLTDDGSLTEEAQAFKDEYENRRAAQIEAEWKDNGLEITPAAKKDIHEIAKIDNETLAEEWFIASVTGDLAKSLYTGDMQRVIKRDPVTRAAMLSLVNLRQMFGGMISNLGGVFNQQGSPEWGSGFSSRTNIPTELRTLFNRFNEASAGLVDSTKARTKTTGFDPNSPKNFRLIRRNAMFKQEDGKVVTDKNGQPVPIDWAEKRGREQIGRVIERYAAEKEIQGNDGYFYFEADEIPGLIDAIRQDASLNENQVRALEMVLNAIAKGDGETFVFDYNASLKTSRKGKKTYSSNLQTEHRPFTPFNIRVSKKGKQVTIGSWDPRQLEMNIDEVLNRKDVLQLYRGNKAAIKADLEKMMANQKKIARGEADQDVNRREFSPQKLQFLNALFGKVGAGQENINPKLQRAPYGRAGKWAATKTPRLDSINLIDPTGNNFEAVWEYMREMRMPEPSSDAPAPEPAPIPNEPAPEVETVPAPPTETTIRVLNDRGSMVEKTVPVEEAIAILEEQGEQLTAIQKNLNG